MERRLYILSTDPDMGRALLLDPLGEMDGWHDVHEDGGGGLYVNTEHGGQITVLPFEKGTRVTIKRR